MWACYHIHLAVAWVKLICFTLNFTHREETKTGVFLNLKTRKWEILSLLTSSLSDKAKWRPLWTFKTESFLGISHSFQNYKKLLEVFINHHIRKEKKTVQKYCLPFEVVRAMDWKKRKVIEDSFKLSRRVRHCWVVGKDKINKINLQNTNCQLFGAVTCWRISTASLH